MRRFMRFFFYHFYHSLAWTYDFVAAIVSIGRWQAWGQAALPHLRGKRVLEIGFGPGHLQVALNRKGFQAVGLDESQQMIRQARHHLVRNKLPVALSRGYAQFLPFAADSFDSVLSTFPSEYISNGQTLAEVYRVLKPGGRLVVVPMAALAGKAVLERFSRWLFAVTGQSASVDEHFQARIRSLFTESGFRAVTFEAEMSGSTVVIIVAEKITSAESSPSQNLE